MTRLRLRHRMNVAACAAIWLALACAPPPPRLPLSSATEKADAGKDGDPAEPRDSRDKPDGAENESRDGESNRDGNQAGAGSSNTASGNGSNNGAANNGSAGGSAPAGAPSGDNTANAAGGAAPGGAAPSGAGAAGGQAQMPARPTGPVAAACMGKTNENVCEGNVLFRCSENGSYTAKPDCGSAGKCQAGLTTGMCGTCEPGKSECDPRSGTPKTCDATGQWQMGEPCASAALCNAESGQCDQMGCAAEEVRCSSGILEVCNADLTAFEMEADCKQPELCNQEAKRCFECSPGSKVCDGPTLNTCSADGMLMPQRCGGNTPYCLEGACVECESASDCQPSNACVQAACMAGSCVDGSPVGVLPRVMCSRTLGGEGVCNGLGTCVGCVTDADCGDPSLRCNPVNLLDPCETRSPLTATASALGGYVVDVAPNFKVTVAPPAGFTPTINFGTVPCCSSPIPADPEARSFTFSGPTCSG
ncbi:MAG: hypothetical protein ABW321_00670, partial [Polyangiales bacterium]